jgi:hypothetical protein
MPIVGLCDGEGGWIHGRALFMSDFEEACVLEGETPSEGYGARVLRRRRFFGSGFCDGDFFGK